MNFRKSIELLSFSAAASVANVLLVTTALVGCGSLTLSGKDACKEQADCVDGYICYQETCVSAEDCVDSKGDPCQPAGTTSGGDDSGTTSAGTTSGGPMSGGGGGDGRCVDSKGDPCEEAGTTSGADDGDDCSGIDCYTGPAGTNGVGVCMSGIQWIDCDDQGGSCEGEVLPTEENCSNGLDDDCDGEPDNKEQDCQAGTTSGGGEGGSD